MYAEGVEGVITEETVSVVRRRTRALGGLGKADCVTLRTLLSCIEIMQGDCCPTNT